LVCRYALSAIHYCPVFFEVLDRLKNHKEQAPIPAHASDITQNDSN